MKSTLCTRYRICNRRMWYCKKYGTHKKSHQQLVSDRTNSVATGVADVLFASSRFPAIPNVNGSAKHYGGSVIIHIDTFKQYNIIEWMGLGTDNITLSFPIALIAFAQVVFFSIPFSNTSSGYCMVVCAVRARSMIGSLARCLSLSLCVSFSFL